MSFVKLGHHNG